MATFLKCDGCGDELAPENRVLARVALTIAVKDGADFIPVRPRRDAPAHYDLCSACLQRLEKAVDPRNFGNSDLDRDLSAALADHGFGDIDPSKTERVRRAA
ncbi:MAG: hypothetical protein EPN45_19485 [Rhizobiaceae bacterium]|nr:MAG: hypothetical protein EPN45_19485 [Rhizobiaceae bacterium]